MVRFVQLRCWFKALVIDDVWDKIRATMSTQVRITMSLRDEHGQQLYVRKIIRLNGRSTKAYGGLELTLSTRAEIKTVMQVKT